MDIQPVFSSDKFILAHNYSNKVVSLLLMSLFFLNTPLKALAVSFSKNAPLFYKSPNSQYPSGQTSEEDLLKYLMRSENMSTFQVQWDKKDYQFKADELVQEIYVADQAYSVFSGPIQSLPQSKSSTLSYLNKNEVVKIISINSEWAEIKHNMSSKIGYVPLTQLESFSEDLGVGFTYMTAYLKKAHSDKSEILTVIPPRERVWIKFWEQDKVYVEYKNFQGYVDNQSLYSKADFATSVLVKKGWVKVQYREGSILKTEDDHDISISSVKAYKTNNKRAFSLINKEIGPKIRSRLELKSLTGDIWNVSKMPDHGEVWWKRTKSILNESEKTLELVNIETNLNLDKLTDLKTKNQNSKFITTHEVLNKNIFSYAFYPQDEIKGLLSANGVYKTMDGKKWEKIDFFNNQNWPVSISKDNKWYVGNYVSNNEGKTFEPYLKLDQLSKFVEEKFSTPPRFLKLLRLETAQTNKIDIWMDTGNKKIHVRHFTNDQSWKLLN